MDDTAATHGLESSLDSLIAGVVVPGIRIAFRLIAVGDENALLPDERPPFEASVVRVRRASGAARIAARNLLASFGHDLPSIPRGTAGKPIWPSGIVGSLTHDHHVAVAAIAQRDQYFGLGIDIEPVEALPEDLLPIVATPAERKRIGDATIAGRVLFSAKEAVYKAVYPLDGLFLDHLDVEIDFGRSQGFVNNGRIVDLRFAVGERILTLAYLRAGLG